MSRLAAFTPIRHPLGAPSVVEWDPDHRYPGHRRCPVTYDGLEHLVLWTVDTYPVAIEFSIPERPLLGAFTCMKTVVCALLRKEVRKIPGTFRWRVGARKAFLEKVV